MSISTTKQSVINKLNDMQSLKVVYGYSSANPDGKYPMATVTLGSGTGEFRSTAHNLRERIFTVKVYQEKMSTGQGDEQAETIVTNVIDEMETAFDMDTTLSGACKFVRAIDWVADYEDREHDTRVLTINITAVDLVSAQ